MITIIIIIYTLYLDLHPEVKFGKEVKKNKVSFAIGKFFVLIALLVRCVLLNLVMNFRDLYNIFDFSQYIGAIHIITVLVFSFWGRLITFIWSTFLAVKIIVLAIKGKNETNDIKYKIIKKARNYFFGKNNKKSESYLILDELKYFHLLFL